MKTVNIISYLLLAGVAALTLWETTRLLRRFPDRALRAYRIALAGFFGSAILGIIGNYILQEMLYLQDLPGAAHATAAWVFGLLSFPLTILALDAFTVAFLAWAGKRYPRAWRIAFFSLQAVLVAAFIAAGPGFFKTPADGADAAVVLVHGLQAANRLYPALVAAAVAFAWSRKSVSSSLQGFVGFAGLYAGLFFAAFILLNVLPDGPGQRAFQSASAFLIHPLPVYVLGRALKRSRADHVPGGNVVEPADLLPARFRISEREAEIVRLLAKGKSYREIGAELFISIKTVKTHVYNIYRKTGVKSRWQLLDLIGKARDESVGS